MEILSGTFPVNVYGTVNVPARKKQQREIRFGVGEEVQIMPGGSLPPNHQNARWGLVSGQGQLLNHDEGGRATYTARNLNLDDFTKGEKQYHAVLELKDGNTSLVKIKLTFICPTECLLIRTGTRHHRNGSANCGFRGQVCLGPADVSFMRVEVKETRGTIVSEGVGLRDWMGQIHADTVNWITAHQVTQQGTLMTGTDTVWSPADTVQGQTFGPLYGNKLLGECNWDIAWMYRLVGENTATGLQFGKAWHKTYLYRNGNMLVEKGGVVETSKLTDPPVNYP